jgi:hypothetical protein
MSRFRLGLLILGVGFLSLFISIGAQAAETSSTTTTIVERQIITPAPKAVCKSIAGHWEGNVWVDVHNVCRYENRTEGAAWIDSYWSCLVADAAGTCTNWQLVAGHWVKTLE